MIILKLRRFTHAKCLANSLMTSAKYRPISIVPNLKQTLSQIHAKSDKSVSKPDILKVSVQLWKRFNAKCCFMAMIEKLRKFLDKGGYAGARLTNLPKKKCFPSYGDK